MIFKSSIFLAFLRNLSSQVQKKSACKVSAEAKWSASTNLYSALSECGGPVFNVFFQSDESIGLGQHFESVISTNRKRVPAHLVFQHFRRNDFEPSHLAELDDSQNRFRFKRDPYLALAIQRPLDAACVEINFHAGDYTILSPCRIEMETTIFQTGFSSIL